MILIVELIENFKVVFSIIYLHVDENN